MGLTPAQIKKVLHTIAKFPGKAGKQAKAVLKRLAKLR